MVENRYPELELELIPALEAGQVHSNPVLAELHAFALASSERMDEALNLAAPRSRSVARSVQ